MKPENRKMLVRGVVGIGNRQSGVISTDLKDAIEYGTIVAYTHWYRHDDNLDELEKDLDSLVNCYRRMGKTSSMSYTYEYKEYQK